VAKAATILLNIFSGVVAAITGIVNGIRSLISLLANPIIKGVGAVAGLFGGGRADGGAVTGGTSYLVGERGAEIFKPSSSGRIIPNRAMSGGGGTVINVNVTGAIDPEGVSRSIVNALNNSFYRGGGGGSNSLVTV
jgi:phage-related minor tail protein